MKTGLLVVSLFVVTWIFAGCFGLQMAFIPAELKDTSILQMARKGDTTAMTFKLIERPNAFNTPFPTIHLLGTGVWVSQYRTVLDVVEDSTTTGWLISHGADLIAPLPNGTTPVMRHVFRNGTDTNTLICMIHRGGSVNTPRKDKAILEQYAQERDPFTHQMHFVRQSSDNEEVNGQSTIDYRLKGETALHFAAMHGNVPYMKVLIANGANANVIDTKLRTPLHLACLTRELDAVKVLVEHGCPINAKDEDGKTPLALCNDSDSKTSKTELVQYLIDHGGAY